MAKQCGLLQITGTIGNLCFYKMGDEYYVRLKSSLSGKRVKTEPAFRRTMVYAGMLARASKIASALYRSLPEESREHALYRKMTGAAMQLIKTGLEDDRVAEYLAQAFVEKPAEIKKTIEARPGVLWVNEAGILKQPGIAVPDRLLGILNFND